MASKILEQMCALDYEYLQEKKSLEATVGSFTIHNAWTSDISVVISSCSFIFISGSLL